MKVKVKVEMKVLRPVMAPPAGGEGGALDVLYMPQGCSAEAHPQSSSSKFIFEAWGGCGSSWRLPDDVVCRAGQAGAVRRSVAISLAWVCLTD